MLRLIARAMHLATSEAGGANRFLRQSATVTPGAFDEMGGDRAGAYQADVDAGALQLGSQDDVVEIGGVDVGDGPVETQAGVVDQDVDAAERLVRGPNHALDLGLVRDIGGDDRDASPAGRRDRGGDAVEVRLAPRRDGDAGAPSRKLDGGGLPDSPGGAGDKDAGALDLHGRQSIG